MHDRNAGPRSVSRYRAPNGRRLTAGEVARAASAGPVGWPPGPSDQVQHRMAPALRSRPESAATRKRRRPGVGKAVGAARVAVALCSVTVLGFVGVAWGAAHQVSTGFGRSAALGSAPTSGGGAENILLMGLDTRKDADGNDLSPEVLAQLHAGGSDNGGYNTNTLILVHIPADRKNIVAFSIPRDDLVTVDDVDVPRAKIKEAYGRRKAIVEQQLLDQGITDPQTLESRGREAGRASTLQTVRALTGVPIDRFAEVSLVGFYDVAQALGGIDVCLNHPVHDSYSGARFPAGRRHLNASQALAFVRQRHGLDNGDLDRTHRQQAFLLSVLHRMQSTGMLTDPGQLNRLMSALNRDVVLSDNWDLLPWGQQMLAPTGQRISFRTLAVERYDTLDGEDVNIVDTDQIRTLVQTAFGMPVEAPTATGAGTAAAGASAAADSTSTSVPDQAGPQPDTGGAVTAAGGVPCVD